MKTKRTSSGGRSAKRKKTHGNTCISSVLGRSFDTPRDFVEFLLSPVPLDTFTTKHWEQEPLLCQSRDGHAEFWAPLFGKDMFFGLLKEKSIHFARDVAVCKYADGKRTDFERQGRVTEAKMRKLFEDNKATMQIHQPQRWVNGLWEALEMLECFFGCLVGCNAYVTPPVAQGLAPHYDDVEVFIVQLEGEKCWKLYKPPVELPRSYSKNFDEAEIGTPTHEFTLKPGDLLYMPRGTIHQAWTPESSGTHSTHITISTYQNHTVGDCLKAVAPDLIDAAVDSCAELRRGLPMQFLPHSRLSKAAVEAALEAVLNHVRKTQDVELVSEDMVLDFMRTRLPPFGVDRRAISETTPDGKAPGVNDSVRFRYPSHVTYLLDDGTAAEGEDGTAEESSSYSLAEQPLQQHRGEKMVLLVTSVFNNREVHMVSTGGDEDDDDEDSEVAKFPLHFLDAIKTLCASKEFVCGKDLSLPSDEDRLLLLTTLWSLHLLDVRES